MPKRGQWPGRRKPIDRDAPTPAVVIATGEISPADKALVTTFLARLGLKATMLSPDDFTSQAHARAVVVRSAVEASKDRGHFLFGEITSPDDYLVREHLEDLKASNPRLRKAFVGELFNRLVDEQGPRRTELPRDDAIPYGHRRKPVYRAAEPMAGIEVVLRKDIDLPGYQKPLDTVGKSTFCALHAVRAGSITEAVSEMDLASRIGNLTLVEQDLLLVSDVLASQFDIDVSKR
jgi:hypothetical protein